MSSDDDEYEYFMGFVATMTNLTSDSFFMLFDYESDERLDGINLRELVEYVGSPVPRMI